MADYLLNALVGAVTLTVAEEPVSGQTGVWIKQGTTVVSSAMTMRNAVVSSGQTQFVYSRGAAKNCTVKSGGVQHVSHGGVASGCDVLHFQYIHSGGTALATTAHYRQYVSSGGSAVGTILRVSPELAASVYPALSPAAGAFVSGVVAESRGSAWVQTDSAFDFSAISSGYILVYGGFTLSGAVISSTGRLYIQSGGTALAVTSNAGATVTVTGGGHIEYA